MDVKEYDMYIKLGWKPEEIWTYLMETEYANDGISEDEQWCASTEYARE